MTEPAIDLFEARTQEVRADHLLPNDRIRRIGRTLRVLAVEITHDAPTIVRVRPVVGAEQRLTIPASEIIAVLP